MRTRHLAAIGLAGMLAACGAKLPAVNFNTAMLQGTADAALITGALSADMKNIANVPGVTPGKAAKAQGDALAMLHVPSMVGRAGSVSEAQVAVGELERGLNDVFAVALAPPISLPALIVEDKVAMYVLLMSLQSNVGMTETPAPPPVSANVLALTPDDARAQLKTAAKR